MSKLIKLTFIFKNQIFTCIRDLCSRQIETASNEFPFVNSD